MSVRHSVRDVETQFLPVSEQFPGFRWFWFGAPKVLAIETSHA